MARKMSRFAVAMSTPEFCRILLIIFASLVVVVPWLLKMTSFGLLLVAGALTLPAIFWWQYRAVRVIARIIAVLLMAAAPVLLIVIAAMGYFYTEFFVALFVSALSLPMIAVSSRDARRFDKILLRVAAVLNTVEAVLLIAYIFIPGGWIPLILFAAINFCFAVLAVLSFPPDLSPLYKKMDEARAKYEK